MSKLEIFFEDKMVTFMYEGKMLLLIGPKLFSVYDKCSCSKLASFVANI